MRILVSYLNADQDDREAERYVREAERNLSRAICSIRAHCHLVIANATSELGGIDILVNNAAHQSSFKSISDESGS